MAFQNIPNVFLVLQCFLLLFESGFIEVSPERQESAEWSPVKANFALPYSMSLRKSLRHFVSVELAPRQVD